jgi:hypothetical protein
VSNWNTNTNAVTKLMSKLAKVVGCGCKCGYMDAILNFDSSMCGAALNKCVDVCVENIVINNLSGEPSTCFIVNINML